MKALKTSILASAVILSLMAATSVYTEGRLSKVDRLAKYACNVE